MAAYCCQSWAYGRAGCSHYLVERCLPRGLGLRAGGLFGTVAVGGPWLDVGPTGGRAVLLMKCARWLAACWAYGRAGCSIRGCTTSAGWTLGLRAGGLFYSSVSARWGGRVGPTGGRAVLWQELTISKAICWAYGRAGCSCEFTREGQTRKLGLRAGGLFFIPFVRRAVNEVGPTGGRAVRHVLLVLQPQERWAYGRAGCSISRFSPDLAATLGLRAGGLFLIA